MKQTVYEHDFRDAFREMGRGDNFSYGGLGALYDYLTQMEEDCNQEMELDVISLCCDFTEYDSLEDMLEAYPAEYDTLEALQDYTTVIDIPDGGYIV